MMEAMRENHDNLEITNLSEAIKTKSAEEVNKMFVESASYILRATIEKGRGKKKQSKEERKAASSGENLWDPKKLAVNDIFSCVSYLQV